MDRSSGINNLGARIGGETSHHVRMQCLTMAQHIVPAVDHDSPTNRADAVIAAARKLEAYVIGDAAGTSSPQGLQPEHLQSPEERQPA